MFMSSKQPFISPRILYPAITNFYINSAKRIGVKTSAKMAQ
jgi:hypothetical protein